MPDKITIMDGGMGRELERIGAPYRRPEWSALALMEGPEYVAQAHNSFIDAGAEIIITNSYAIIPFHIGQEKFDTEARSLIKLAGEIAKKCADDASHKVTIAGSIPPAFGSYRPDLYIDEEAEAIYRPLIEEQEPYVDVWLAETVSATYEVIKIKEFLGNSTKPFWVSYTLRDRQGENIPSQLRSGETIEEAIQTALDLKAETILFNCSQPEEMEPVLDILQTMNLEVPYGVYANGFQPIKKDQKANSENVEIREDISPQIYFTFAEKWKEKGASIIGGCCGITPEHIKKISEINE